MNIDWPASIEHLCASIVGSFRSPRVKLLVPPLSFQAFVEGGSTLVLSFHNHSESLPREGEEIAIGVSLSVSTKPVRDSLLDNSNSVGD